MKRYSALLFGVCLSVFAMVANAHDPSMHKNENREPDCTVMDEMADSTTAATDAVAQAMTMKCPEGMKDHDEMPESEHQMHTTETTGAPMSSMDEEMKHSQKRRRREAI